MRILLLAAVGLFIAGCQTPGPQVRQAAPGPDPTETCFSTLPHNPRVSFLQAKMGRFGDPESATLDQRSSAVTADEEEKKAIQTLAGIRRECVLAGEEFRSKYAPPGYSSIVEEGNSRFTVLLAKLYAGQFNYGQFVSERIELAREMRAKRSTLRDQLNRENAQARQQAAARQQAEFDNALLLLQLSQPRPAPPQPPVSCVSRAVGSSIHTNCNR